LLCGFFARFFASLLEQKAEGLVSADVGGDAGQSPLLLKLGARHRDSLALLPCDAVYLAVDFLLRRADGFPFADLIQDQRSPYVAYRAVFLRFTDFGPVELDLIGIDALRGQRPLLIFDVDLDLPVDIGVGNRKIMRVHQLVD